MAARVLEIDLAKPLAPIPTQRKYAAYWCLIRFGHQPVGWVRFRRAIVGNWIQPDYLHGLIAEQIGPQVIDAMHRGPQLSREAPHTPPISVVICTREHPDQLLAQLKSLRKLYYPEFEVIVVDNAPVTNRTKFICDEYFHNVRYVLEPRKGLDYARNTGWRNAKHGIVAYTDDDAYVDPFWLTAIGQAFKDQRVNCVTGITFPMELETSAQEHFERYGGMQRGFNRRVYKPGTWSPFYPLGSGRFGAGVNLALRKSALIAMGGFDEALDVGSLARGGGDLDIMARCIRDGGHLVYEPAAIVWHQHRKTMAQLRKQMFDYGWGFCAYVAKHSRDLELGNQSLRMLKKWTKEWGIRRLKKNLRLAMRFRGHFPVHLILIEILGGILGLRAYKRSVRHVQSVAMQSRLAALREKAA
jgi:glycosyltransferase involved in cell wall biosynthesis